jgi:hypothetical protein
VRGIWLTQALPCIQYTSHKLRLEFICEIMRYFCLISGQQLAAFSSFEL